jgi:hypothetical protein
MFTSFEPDKLASAKATAIAQGEHHLIPEAAGHGKQPLRLVGAHGERQLLRLLEVVDLELKAANVVGGGRVGGTLEECGEALAAIDVAAL